MITRDLHWQQQFSQYEKAILLLQSAISIEKPSVIERAGMIHFFELAFELSLKLIKAFEEVEGLSAKSPRGVIKQALQFNLIRQEHGWLEALENIYLTTQIYHEDTAIVVEKKIREEYFPCLLQLRQDLENKHKR